MEEQEITSLQHPLIKHLIKLRTNKKYREEKKTLCLEGLKVVQEVPDPLHIFYTNAYASHVSQLKGKKTKISESVLQKISGLVSPEGIIAEVHMPSYKKLISAKKILAFDGVSDPGNMGVLLRTALAFGWEYIYFLSHCCDPFNDKVIRAARGAHFHLSFIKGDVEQLQEWSNSHQAQSLVADLDGLPPEQISTASARILIIGNEAHGPSKAIKQFSQSVTIPMNKKMESLNAAMAGGILLYLLRDLQ